MTVGSIILLQFLQDKFVESHRDRKRFSTGGWMGGDAAPQVMEQKSVMVMLILQTQVMAMKAAKSARFQTCFVGAPVRAKHKMPE